MNSTYPTVPRARASRTRKPGAWSITGTIFLILLGLFATLPMVWMVLTSVKTQFAALQFPPEWLPRNPTLHNYINLLSPGSNTGREFLRYMLNSLYVSTCTTILGIILAVPAAYAFSRFHFPGRHLLFYSVLLRNMFPGVVLLMPLFILMRLLRLVNTEICLILTYLTFGLPLSIWLLKGFYDNIPPQLEQAARIDGASRFQAFLRVAMPLSTPGIIATAIYAFIGAWNEYVYALTFLNDKSKLTLPVGLQHFFTEYSTDWPGLMAGSFIMSIPVVAMFLVLQRYFVRALTEGAIKS
jgi:multiple sugar transport system permease protein